MASYRRGTCRLCAGADLLPIIQFKPVPLADAFVSSDELGEPQNVYPLDVFLCRNCSHVQLLENIYQRNHQKCFFYITDSTLGLVEHIKRYVERISQIINISTDTFVVNIGSNDGTMLKYFAVRGAKVLGVESEDAIAQLAEKAGVRTIPASFTYDLATMIRNNFGPANLVVFGSAHNLFANVNDLDEAIKGVRHLLAADGMLVFEVGYLVDLYQRYLFDNIYHEHLGYHSVQPLITFFNQLDMRLFHVERVDIKGGSIRNFVQLSGGPHATSPSVSEFASLESTLGIHHPQSYKAFMQRICSVKVQLLDYIMELIRENKRIIGYGASPTTTMLTSHFGLGSLLNSIVDDDPQKQGKFSPGYHIPILSPDTIYETNPDYILVLAWRYADAIIAKHQKFLRSGGHFIVPLPEMRVI